MLGLKDEYAIQYAMEIAKIVCANPNYAARPDKESAEELADFISTLESRFLADE